MSFISWIRSLGGADLDCFIAPEIHANFRTNPVVVYDIGASVELMTPLPLSNAGKAPVFGFEPVDASYQALIEKYRDAPDVEIHKIAFTSVTGTDTLNFYDDALTSTSLLARTSHHWRTKFGARRVEVNSSRLDDASSLLGIPPPNFLKLDTEGSEIIILENGPNMLRRHVLGIFSEITFMKFAEGGAMFRDLDRLIAGHDFVLFDLQVSRADRNRVGGKKGPCSTGDALYLKDFFNYYQSVLKHEDPAFARAQGLRMIAICLGYRYLTYALEVAYFLLRHGHLSRDEYALIYDQLAAVTNIAEWMPVFSGRLNIARLFDFLAHLFYPSENKGMPPMSNAIGNRRISLMRGAVPEAVKPGYLLREHVGKGSGEFEIPRRPE